MKLLSQQLGCVFKHRNSVRAVISSTIPNMCISYERDRKVFPTGKQYPGYASTTENVCLTTKMTEKSNLRISWIVLRIL